MPRERPHILPGEAVLRAHLAHRADPPPGVVVLVEAADPTAWYVQLDGRALYRVQTRTGGWNARVLVSDARLQDLRPVRPGVGVALLRAAGYPLPS